MMHSSVKFYCRFGFVEFESTEAAKSAYEAMKDQEIEGRKVKIDFATELKNPPKGDFKQGSWGGTGRGGQMQRGRGGRGGRGKLISEMAKNVVEKNRCKLSCNLAKVENNVVNNEV